MAFFWRAFGSLPIARRFLRRFCLNGAATELALFRSCLNSALDRKYFVDRWISDQSLVTLLNTICYLEISKSYLNRYIHSVYLTDYQFYDKVIHKIKNEENKPSKTIFYYFTGKNSRIPRYLSMTYKWQQIYDNFCVLRSRTSNDHNHDVNDSVLIANGYKQPCLSSLLC